MQLNNILNTNYKVLEYRILTTRYNYWYSYEQHKMFQGRQPEALYEEIIRES